MLPSSSHWIAAGAVTTSLPTREGRSGLHADEAGERDAVHGQRPSGVSHGHAGHHGDEHAGEKSHAERVDRRPAERPFAGDEEAASRRDCSSIATGSQA